MELVSICFERSRKRFEAKFQRKKTVSLFLFTNKAIPLDIKRKLNVLETFRKRFGLLMNVLCAFNFCPVSRGIIIGMFVNVYLGLYSAHHQMSSLSYRTVRKWKQKLNIYMIQAL